MSDCFIVHKDLPQTDLHPNKFTIVTNESGSVALSQDLDENHLVKVDASIGAIIVTLPSAIGIKGQTYTFVKIDSNNSNFITLDGYLTETIDGNLSEQIKKQWEAITVMSDNSNWYMI